MRLVLASRHDAAARGLVGRWGSTRAALVTATDLSGPGWRHRVGGGDEGAAAAGGRVIDAREIDGIVVRLAAVPPEELDHICPEDRGYVAAEMTAFLLAWLDERRCRVANRPTPGCLNGPAWRGVQWARAAAAVGLPVAAPTGRAAAGEVVVTVVGERCLGGAHPRRSRQARLLAARAGVDLLAVRLGDAGPDAPFLGASAWVDVADPLVADALDAQVAGGC